MSYHYRKSQLAGEAIKYELYRRDSPLRFSEFLSLIKGKKPFRRFFVELLSEIPFQAWQWETPPVTVSSVDQPFEFVVTDSPGIDLPPDPEPFRSYFKKLGEGKTVVDFFNLGGDARLIAPAPSPGDETRNYSHIGVFTQNAPEKEQHALWQKTGVVTLKQLSGRPLWLNTAGGGVAWLHIRLDSRPKYYRHRPYRSFQH